jgi:hypothetical protein
MSPTNVKQSKDGQSARDVAEQCSMVQAFYSYLNREHAPLGRDGGLTAEGCTASQPACFALQRNANFHDVVETSQGTSENKHVESSGTADTFPESWISETSTSMELSPIVHLGCNLSYCGAAPM